MDLLESVLAYLEQVADELKFISTEEEADELEYVMRDRIAEFRLMQGAAQGPGT